jgi:hypothetical protein
LLILIRSLGRAKEEAMGVLEEAMEVIEEGTMEYTEASARGQLIWNQQKRD